jgi:hypothetical protein
MRRNVFDMAAAATATATAKIQLDPCDEPWRHASVAPHLIFA